MVQGHFQERLDDTASTSFVSRATFILYFYTEPGLWIMSLVFRQKRKSNNNTTEEKLITR